ncbi:DUF2538 family protein [Cytobacillus suaedae]|nr:DUF2538 family protein [Cytobacillus suaedae]
MSFINELHQQKYRELVSTYMACDGYYHMMCYVLALPDVKHLVNKVTSSNPAEPVYDYFSENNRRKLNRSSELLIVAALSLWNSQKEMNLHDCIGYWDDEQMRIFFTMLRLFRQEINI